MNHLCYDTVSPSLTIDQRHWFTTVWSCVR